MKLEDPTSVRNWLLKF